VNYFFAIILGAPIAAIGGVLASRVTSGLTEWAEGGSHHGMRSWTIRFAAILPFICVAWFALVCASFVDGDIDGGGNPYAPLPNGYGFGFFTGDGASLGKRGPKIMSNEAGFVNMDSYIRSMQVADTNVLGFVARPSYAFGPKDRQYYFLADLAHERNEQFPTLAALQIAARAKGISVHLEPSTQVYDRLSRKPKEWLSTLVLVVPPLAATAVLGMAIVRLRRLPSPPRRW
jgi:hypothetical protein